MKSTLMVLLFCFFSVILVQCKKTEATDCNLSGNTCSCDRTTLTNNNPDCRDYEAMSAETASKKCTNEGLTLNRSTLCPTSSRMGTCKFTVGGEITYQRYYSSNYSTAASAAAVCAYFKANCFILSGNALCDAVWTSDT